MKCVVILTLVCAGALQAAAQCGLVNRDSQEEVGQEVNRLFNTALDGMEYALPSGVKVVTWRPPDSSVHDQIACLGGAAVPATAELLLSTKRSFGHLLAIRMLGWEGGAEIVPPLTQTLSKSDSSLMLKLEALESLASAPPDRALPVVREVLRSEKDPHLLNKAEAVAARLESGTKQ